MSHSHNVTVSHSHNVTMSQCHTVTVSQCHTVTMSQCHSVTQSQCHNVTQSQCHNVTVSQCHTVTVSQIFVPCPCPQFGFRVGILNKTVLYSDIPVEKRVEILKVSLPSCIIRECSTGHGVCSQVLWV